MSFIFQEMHILTARREMFYPYQAYCLEIGYDSEEGRNLIPLCSTCEEQIKLEDSGTFISAQQSQEIIGENQIAPVSIHEMISTVMNTVSNSSDTSDDNEYSESVNMIKSLRTYFLPTLSFLKKPLYLALCYNIDAIIDGALKLVRAGIIGSGKERILIPDVNKESLLFGYTIFVAKVEGIYFGSIGTIYRRSEINVESKENGDYHAEGAFGLSIMEFGVSEYLLKLLGIGPRGMFMSKVGRGRIRLSFTLSPRRKNFWNPYIEWIYFEQFEDFDFKINGFWILNYLIELFLNFLIPRIWNTCSYTLEETIVTQVRKALDEIDNPHFSSANNIIEIEA